MDGVAGLCPAARGGPLQREEEREPSPAWAHGDSHSRDTESRAGEPRATAAPGAGSWGWLRAQGRLQHLQILGQAPASPRQTPKDRELSHPARTTGKEPLHIPSHLLVSQEELQVTVSPLRIRLCPWLQLVPLVIPAVQVLQAQRDKREALGTLPRRRISSRDQGIFIPLRSWGRKILYWIKITGCAVTEWHREGPDTGLWLRGDPGCAGCCSELRSWGCSEEGRHPHLQANHHVPQEIVLPFVFASVFKDPERHKTQGVGRCPVTRGGEGHTHLLPSLPPSKGDF